MIYSSWDIEFWKPKTKKIRILNHEKNCWRYNHFTYMYQSRQSHEVQFLRYEVRKTEFFCHFGPFFALLLPYQPRKSKLTKITKTMIIWCMLPEIWSATNKNFCHFGSLFALSPPTNNPIYWKLEKCKKTLEGDIFLLHMCAINKSYMMYGSWGIRHNRQLFVIFSYLLSFYSIFPFWPS